MMHVQPSLFEEEPSIESVNDSIAVPGLTHVPDFLDSATQAAILSEIAGRPWMDDLKRRVQHYGYRYDYKAKRADASMYLGELPEFAGVIATRLLTDGLVDQLPDQMIVNEYKPGQGIAPHVDCVPCFDESIVTISLGSVYEMEFISLDTREKKVMSLALGSALVMQGDARYRWQHTIRPRQSDGLRRRETRISLTLRKMKLG